VCILCEEFDAELSAFAQSVRNGRASWLFAPAEVVKYLIFGDIMEAQRRLKSLLDPTDQPGWARL
jgi:hypothetical protein